MPLKICFKRLKVTFPLDCGNEKLLFIGQSRLKILLE
jgi:hypothetical protein